MTFPVARPEVTGVIDLLDNFHKKQRSTKRMLINVNQYKLARVRFWWQADHFSLLRSNLYIHTLAWDVGILVSSRNWNIPRITWSIIPIVCRSPGGTQKYFLDQSKNKNKKKKKLDGLSCRLLPSSPVRLKTQKSRFHSPVSLPWKDSKGGIVSVYNNNFILLHFSLNLNCTRSRSPTPTQVFVCYIFLISETLE